MLHTFCAATAGSNRQGPRPSMPRARARGAASQSGSPSPRHLDCSPAAAFHGMVQVKKSLAFIERHNLWTDEQRRQADELKRRVEKDDLNLVRLAWADPHGAARAKAVTVPAFLGALETGYNINVATTTLDSPNPPTFPSFTPPRPLRLHHIT